MKKVRIFLIFLLLINTSYAYEIEYIHQDHLGNNIAVTDQEGKVIWKADYEPFGDSFNELNENNNYKYNSKELDASTGLLYYGARYYDSDIGRFTTPDPVSGSITAPQSLNRYVYVQNNPLKYIDPTGNEVSNVVGLDLRYLDMEWYSRMIPEAVNYGIDPYFYVAMTIKEMGGIRQEGHSQGGQTDMKFREGYKNMGIFGVMIGYGAGAVLLGDAIFYGRIFDKNYLVEGYSVELTDAAKRAGWTTKQEKIINDQLYIMGGRNRFQTKEEAYNPKSPSNIISFTLLQGHFKTRVEPATAKLGAVKAFQLLNPGEPYYGENMMQIINAIETEPEFESLRRIIIKEAERGGMITSSLDISNARPFKGNIP
jgi:RHS repeat-associated protein